MKVGPLGNGCYVILKAVIEGEPGECVCIHSTGKDWETWRMLLLLA